MGYESACHTFQVLENNKPVSDIIVRKPSSDRILPTSSFEVLKSMCYYAVRDSAIERKRIFK